MVAAEGVSLIDTPAGLVTVSKDSAECAASAANDAVTVASPSTPLAVKTPSVLMLPFVAAQFTRFSGVPLTLAVNCWDVPNWIDPFTGEMVSATRSGEAVAEDEDCCGVKPQPKLNITATRNNARLTNLHMAGSW